MRAEDVLYFWFAEIDSKMWWQKSDDFDAMLRRRFLPTLEQAAAGELACWRKRERGRLAEIIVLDQFSRNIFRDTPKAFVNDAMALSLAQEAVLQGVGQTWSVDMLQFLYMPYMHSESLAIHEEAVRLFSKPGMENNLEFEHKHKEIIERFGRYPHRNAILGRISTAEEIEFLTQPGSSF